MGGRHYYLAKELTKLGYEVHVIAASYSHLLRKAPELSSDMQVDDIDGFKFVWLKVPKYKMAHSKQRVLNWFIFGWRLRSLQKKLVNKPDVILYSSPSLVGFLSANYLANKLKSKLVFEVRDIWPKTLVDLGGYSTKHPFIRFLQWIERKAYKTSDKVVSNLENAIVHMASHGMEKQKFAWIPNGVSLEEMNQKSAICERIASSIPKDKFIVGYTGTLGVANAMEWLIEAASILVRFEGIHFVIVGSGKETNALKSLAEELTLSNVTFIGAIPKVQIQSVLSLFDICFIGWRNDSLYEYGIGANKIPEYLHSGKPILHSYSGLCDPVNRLGAGITVPAEDPNAIADGILHLYELPAEERHKMGRIGNSAAVNHYEYGMLAKKLGSIFNEL